MMAVNATTANRSASSDLLLSVHDLTTAFSIPGKGLFAPARDLKAVNEVSFNLQAGEILGVVGESGCGKSTLGRTILRLVEPTSGTVLWQGEDLAELSGEAMRRRRRDMQIIFQDPIASLDPRMTIGDTIGEPLIIFEPEMSRKERQHKVLETMGEVGLSADMLNRYPHEFSGGQAQRIGIARAIITKPKLLICDEPVSALDVSIQAQIVNLLQDLKRRFGLTMIFISHDLSVVRLIADRVLVLYLGRVVEMAETSELFDNPGHPYSQALLSAAPIPDPKIARNRARVPLAGDPPSPLDPPSGCVFRTRCPIAEGICAEAVPPVVALSPTHGSACHFAGETVPTAVSGASGEI